MGQFIGRKKILEDLKSLVFKKIASFVVIRGRRRIGKSRLIEEFGAGQNLRIFLGLPPTREANRQGQIDQFCTQMSAAFDLPKFQMSSWWEVFVQLGKLCAKGRVVLALDEISWIGSKDPDFLGHLKNAWDLYFSKNPKLILIVCGSVSSWIEKNILSATGFVGRISKDIHLPELPLSEAAEFWDGKRGRVAPSEILKVLSVTGGVPRYLEEIDPSLSAEENIRQLCFDRTGLLYREFDQIFASLFSKRAERYSELVRGLVGGPKTARELSKQALSTTIDYLFDLVQAGFVTEDPTWHLQTGKSSRYKRYRLSDNYLRFYLRYVLPHRNAIDRGVFEMGSLQSFSDWDGMMGLQFENLVLRNVKSLFPHLHLPAGEVVMFGPFFQRPTQRQKGCQIDLLIQARHPTLFVCEVKFSSRRLGMEVVQQSKEVLKRLKRPRSTSVRPVLIHVNGVSSQVEQADHFDRIIDFSHLVAEK